MVVARVEREPLAVEIDFEPCTEIHRCRIRRHADVAEITGAISCGQVHAAAKRHRKVGEVAADADLLVMTFRCGAVATRMLVTESNPLMGVVADSLRARPARRYATEQRPGKVGELLGVTVTAAQQVDQDVVGQVRDLRLVRAG